jgi:hypothetical protein
MSRCGLYEVVLVVFFAMSSFVDIGVLRKGRVDTGAAKRCVAPAVFHPSATQNTYRLSLKLPTIPKNIYLPTHSFYITTLELHFIAIQFERIASLTPFYLSSNHTKVAMDAIKSVRYCTDNAYPTIPYSTKQFQIASEPMSVSDDYHANSDSSPSACKPSVSR